MKISVIIPVYREEETINPLLRSLMDTRKEKPWEIIVADGDPAGGTLAAITVPEEMGEGVSRVLRIISPKGRAFQMNAGARAAEGDVLLFLHADAFLPENGITAIREAMTSGRYAGGAFKYRLNSRNIVLRYLYWTSWLRAEVNRIPYGDMGIFMSKDFFNRLGGYAEIPIMEDVEFMQRVKRCGGKIRILSEPVTVSPRRYLEEGIIYGWLRNHWLRILYLLGTPPEKLVRYYPDGGKKK